MIVEPVVLVAVASEVELAPTVLARAFETSKNYTVEHRRFFSSERLVGWDALKNTNLEGLGDVWLHLRNASLDGCPLGQPRGEASQSYLLDGSVALALREMSKAGAGTLMVLAGHRPLVRLSPEMWDFRLAERLVEAFVNGDVWRLKNRDWSQVLASLRDVPQLDES